MSSFKSVYDHRHFKKIAFTNVSRYTCGWGQKIRDVSLKFSVFAIYNNGLITCQLLKTDISLKILSETQYVE